MAYNVVVLYDAKALYTTNKHVSYLSHILENLFVFILAIILACLGSFYIFMHRIYCTMKKKYSSSWVFNPWLYTLTIAIIITTTEFFVKLN
jgi:H+/Cl- antiporter ClcA